MKTKDFWKIVLASAIGVLIASIVSTILVLAIAGDFSSDSAFATSGKKSVPANAILDIDMSVTHISEQTKEPNPFESFSFGSKASQPEIRNVGILDAARALEAAATDPSIKAAYIRPDMASDISHLEEFRTALCAFRASGKPLIAYIQTPTNAGYYLASAADRIYISNYHGGMNMLVGISGSMMHVKDLLDKLGINMQLIRHGKYKSAGEMFIKNSPSPENMEQQTAMIKGIWAELAAPMAEKAGMSVDEFNAMIDNLELVTGEDFVKKGMADEAVSLSQIKDKLCAAAGVDDYDDVPSISLADYAAIKVRENHKAKEAIAVIYADGEIVDGYGLDQVAGKRFAKIIDKVRADSTVKAVVLRVNSPGGSVIASSQIKDAVDALKNVKPVVASYGTYAASGGYWISANADYIFSDATCLTGSIGVFGTLPDFSKGIKNILHVNITPVPSNRHSDMYSFMRPLDGEEVAFIQKDIETIYTEFTTIVATGRKMSVEQVDELGQGRVWTGRDALERGLVDRIGGLLDAIQYTADIASMTNYRIEAYPKPLSTMEQILEAFEPANDEELVKIFKEVKSSKEAKIFARLPYNIEIR